MKQRQAVLIGAAMAVGLTAGIWITSESETVAALLRGEHFYHGKPTSFWSKEVQECVKTPFYRSDAHFHELMEERPATIGDRVRQYFGLSYETERPKRPLRDENPKAIPVLVDLLRDPDPTVRMYAAETLGAFGPAAKAAVRELAQLLLDDKIGGFGFMVSEKAAWSLGQIGTDAAEAIPQLLVATEHKWLPIRTAAAVALTRIDPDGSGKAVLQSMMEQARAGSVQERCAAIAGLGEIGHAAAESLPILRKALEDDSEEIRTWARTVLPKVDPEAPARSW
jgi:hypothetical protein